MKIMILIKKQIKWRSKSEPGPSTSKSKESTNEQRSGSRSGTFKESITFNPDCIFCSKEGRKKVKVKGVWTTEPTSMFEFGFEFGGCKAIEMVAEKIGDAIIMTRISGYNLFKMPFYI